MFDASKIDIQALGIEAACNQAYEQGRGEASQAMRCAFCAGMDAGSFAAASCMGDMSTVVDGWFDGDKTILLFADGEKEVVTFRHEPGCAYDREKAVMACILKHAIGNSYIGALRLLSTKKRFHVSAVGKGARAALLEAEDACASDGCVPDLSVIAQAYGAGDVIRCDGGEDEPLCGQDDVVRCNGAEDAYGPEDALDASVRGDSIPGWDEDELKRLEAAWQADAAVLDGADEPCAAGGE